MVRDRFGGAERSAWLAVAVAAAARGTHRQASISLVGVPVGMDGPKGSGLGLLPRRYWTYVGCVYRNHGHGINNLAVATYRSCTDISAHLQLPNQPN